MNFTSLNYFLVAAEELNITHAAERLFISQQALSGHISRLEKELNVELFNRGSALSLTYAGRKLVEYASGIKDLEKQILRTADDISGNIRGELRLGISYTCGRALLPFILPEYHALHPLIEIKIFEGNSSELESRLLKDELDLIIVFGPVNIEGYSSVDLIAERIFLVVPKILMRQKFGACYEAVVSECQRDPDLFLFRNMPFILLKKGNRIRKMLDAYTGKINFEPNIILETENTETAFALAQKGMGITVYPELFYWCIQSDKASVSRSVELFALQDASTVGNLEIGWMKTRYQTRAAEDFVKLCVSALSEIKEQSTGLPDPKISAGQAYASGACQTACS